MSSPLTLVSWPVDAARTLAVSPAKSGAAGRRRPGKTRLNRGQSKASAQFGVGRQGKKLKPETLKAQTRGQRAEVRARRGSSSTLLTGRVVRALENRTGPRTLSIGAGLIRRTPGIAVSKAFFAFPASVCNGWACLWGLAQERGSTIAWFTSFSGETSQAVVGSLFPFWTPFSEAVLRLGIRPECLIQANEDEGPPVHSHSCRAREP